MTSRSAPETLHWTTASCASALLKPRPPSLAELSLPLCPICAVASRPAAGTRSQLLPSGMAAPAPTSAAPAEVKWRQATSVASRLDLAGPRDQAELLMLHVLLQRPGLREYGSSLCRRAGLLGSAEDSEMAEVGGAEGALAGSEAADDGTTTVRERLRPRMRTPKRQELLTALLDPPSLVSAAGLLQMVNSTDVPGTPPCAELQLLRKPSDDLQYLAKKWAQVPKPKPAVASDDAEGASDDGAQGGDDGAQGGAQGGDDGAQGGDDGAQGGAQGGPSDARPPPYAPSEALPARLLEVCVETVAAQRHYDAMTTSIGAARRQLDVLVSSMEAITAKPQWDATRAEDAAETASSAEALARLSAQLALQAATMDVEGGGEEPPP